MHTRLESPRPTIIDNVKKTMVTVNSGTINERINGRGFNWLCELSNHSCLRFDYRKLRRRLKPPVCVVDDKHDYLVENTQQQTDTIGSTAVINGAVSILAESPLRIAFQRSIQVINRSI